MPGTRQWCFGPFRLDPTTESLWRDEVLLPLPPKPFAVLAYLVAHAGQVVSKETLLEAVWPHTAVTEGVLKTCLGQIRQVLGETGQDPAVHCHAPPPGLSLCGARRGAHGGRPSAPRRCRRWRRRTCPTTTRWQRALPALSPPAAERRHLTVLCCDLAGAMALAGRPDPEEYREVLHAYHQTCAEVMQRFDGYVAQYLGNGVLVYFGYPVAHEDDAQRAIRAGLALLDALADAARPTRRCRLASRWRCGWGCIRAWWWWATSGWGRATSRWRWGRRPILRSAPRPGRAQHAGDLGRDAAARRGVFPL